MRRDRSMWAIHLDTFNAALVRLQANGVSDPLAPPPAAAAADPAAGNEPEAALRPATTGGPVAVIPVKGVLTNRASFISFLFGGSSLPPTERVRRMIREAANDDTIGSIVLDIDSPGGSVYGIPELAAEIRTARAAKPIVACSNAMAASAAYHLASQATEIFVTPSGVVGSIGVFIHHEDWSAFEERLGVAHTFVKAGRFKTEGNMFEPLTDEAKAALQAEVDAYYDMFVGDVAAGRGVKPAAVRSGFGEGRLVLAADAVAEGMADQVGTLDEAINRAAQIAHGSAGPRSEVEPIPPASQTPKPAEPGSGSSDDAPSDVLNEAELVAASPSYRAAARRLSEES